MTTIYMPAIFSPPRRGHMTAAARAFAAAWLALHGERAARMKPDARLIACAQDHAEYLASRQGEALKVSMHRGRGGSYSNQRVAATGYRLPSHWALDANYVESCRRGVGLPGEQARKLAAHAEHRDHMLGLGHFADFTVYGVGSCQQDYVCIRCPVEEHG